MKDLAWKSRTRPTGDPMTINTASPFEPGIPMVPDDGRPICSRHLQPIGRYGCTACNVGNGHKARQSGPTSRS